MATGKRERGRNFGKIGTQSTYLFNYQLVGICSWEYKKCETNGEAETVCTAQLSDAPAVRILFAKRMLLAQKRMRTLSSVGVQWRECLKSVLLFRDEGKR